MGAAGRELSRAARWVCLSLLVAACGDLDVTEATGLPEPETPRAAPEDVLAPALPAVDAGAPSEPDEGTERGDTPDAGAAPVDVEVPTPLGPRQRDAGTTAPPDETPTVALDCSALPAAPAVFDVLGGYTNSEDFAFDEFGNYVGVDDDNNLVRISNAGDRKLWAPSIGATAGMAILRDGSLVFNHVEEGALKRVYPNGAISVVLGGLLYPNGLDVGPDGFVYVAENGAGRVRRINPDTGEFSVVAIGLEGPNGVAFSDDPRLLYIGSFEGSGVYKVELPEPGELGQASVFARPGASGLSEPVITCPDQAEGAPCTSVYYQKGVCQALANVIDCMPVDPCPDLADGEYCYFPDSGFCQSGVCVPTGDPCDGKRDGERCENEIAAAGVCHDYDGVLYCDALNPCDGQEPGAACEDPFYGTGSCEGVEGELYCQPPNTCTGLADGDPCTDPFYEVATCQDFGDGILYCAPPNPCADLAVGDACVDPYSGAGTCLDVDGFVYCAPPTDCTGLADSTPCQTPDGVTGTCQAELCIPAPVAGGIDGLGVDACGNVYASEFVYGNVWRIAPDGNIELFAQLPSFWIPNIKWGRNLGGFSDRVMYVADRDQRRLFGIHVGMPGATEFYSLGH
jgi:sugar lactone lactonase YvrE